MKINPILFIVICVGLLAIGLLVGNFFKKTPAPNEALIKELQLQRKANDSAAAANKATMENFITQARERQARDSLQALQQQQQLVKSIQSIKLKYETIPSYTGISKDSLRRLYSAAYGH